MQSIVNFNVAQRTYLGLTCTWALPDRGPYSGVMVRYKNGKYPAHIEDGELAYEGLETYCTISGLTVDTDYYFCAWSYMTTNYGRFYAVVPAETHATVNLSVGEQIYTSSGTLTIPDGIHTVDIFCVGGGGGTGWVKDIGPESWYGSSGAGGGYTITQTGIGVTPGQILTVTVGAGGAGAVMYKGPPSTGNTSIVSAGDRLLIQALGGKGGRAASANPGGDGGSGGGTAPGNSVSLNGAGGSDGSDGKGYNNVVGGKGQGKTTRAFEEITGTLYAGGGGAANKYGHASGGAGGGGSNSNGGANTGGGAGGRRWPGGSPSSFSGGSGIVIIRYVG